MKCIRVYITKSIRSAITDKDTGKYKYENILYRFKALLILFRDVSNPKGTLILLENSTKKGRPISNTHNGVGHV